MLRQALTFCSGQPDDVKFKVVGELLQLFSKEFSPDSTTIRLFERKNEIVKKYTTNKDPMREQKKLGLEAALSVYGDLEYFVGGESNPGRRFRRAVLVALAGNSIEFGRVEHRFDPADIERHLFDSINSKPEVDDIPVFYERVTKARKILYVTDNAGELVCDKILVDELKRYARVFVAPLSKPMQDDATVEDVETAGIVCDVVSKGEMIGLCLDRTPKEFNRVFAVADVVVAKGMACYETIVEHPKEVEGKVVLLMKVKCTPVSRDVGVKLGSTVVKAF